MNISNNTSSPIQNSSRLADNQEAHSSKNTSSVVKLATSIKNAPVRIEKSALSAETFERINQKGIEAKKARKEAIYISEKNKEGLKNMTKVSIDPDLFNRIQQSAAEAKAKRKL